MSSGAFALYIDQQAGEGPNAPIRRIVPFPPISNEGGIRFDHRRLTLSYDGTPATITVTGHFLPTNINAPINVTLAAGECHRVEIPDRACAALFEVNPTNPPHGPISALLEYNS